MARFVACLAAAAALWALSGPPAAAAAQPVSQQSCRGDYLGVPLTGVLTIERWTHYDTHRIYGVFQDPTGNVYEIEVMTNQPGGVGSAWMNGMRHRETYIELALHDGGFVIRTEDGVTSQFSCA